MRIAIAQFNAHVGNFEGNLSKMLQMTERAKAQGADIICFPELATCGYPARDFLDFDDFIRQGDNCVQMLAKAADGIAIVLGSPTRNPKIEGKDLYNSVYFLAEGKVKFVQHKALLPTYDVFDEYRYFEPASEFGIVEYMGKRIALTVCEDIWNVGNENPLYTICPMDEMMPFQPELMINVSASPFAYDHAPERIHVIRANVERYKVPIFYVNHVGGQTELLFDGGSVVMSPNGKVYDEMPFFEECIKVYDLDEVMKGEKQVAQPCEKTPLMHDALVMGIRDYFGKLGLKKAILGLSGGIDSALTLYFAVKALGKQNVLSVLMPSQYSTNHSVDDSLKLVENLDTSYKIIPIKEAFDVLDKILQPHFDGKPFDVTEENMQARIRAIYLMALSNKHGYVLLNTTNKSEAAVGYGTLYGDMCGGLAVLADIYKTQVYDLCRWINRNDEIIPKNIIEKAPSAELRPNQKDSDSLPDYEILDRVLFEYIENIKGPDEIRQILGFEEALIDRILKLVNRAEFKRHQTPPILRISPRAFGSGRRVPIVNKYCQ